MRVHYPELALCTDNGAMIAFAGAMRLGALTVLENVRLAVQARRSQGHGIDLWRVWLDRREWIDEAMALHPTMSEELVLMR